MLECGGIIVWNGGRGHDQTSAGLNPSFQCLELLVVQLLEAERVGAEHQCVDRQVHAPIARKVVRSDDGVVDGDGTKLRNLVDLRQLALRRDPSNDFRRVRAAMAATVVPVAVNLVDQG